MVGHRPLYPAAHLRSIRMSSSRACPARAPGLATCNTLFVAAAVRLRSSIVDARSNREGFFVQPLAGSRRPTGRSLGNAGATIPRDEQPSGAPDCWHRMQRSSSPLQRSAYVFSGYCAYVFSVLVRSGRSMSTRTTRLPDCRAEAAAAAARTCRDAIGRESRRSVRRRSP